MVWDADVDTGGGSVKRALGTVNRRNDGIPPKRSCDSVNTVRFHVVRRQLNKLRVFAECQTGDERRARELHAFAKEAGPVVVLSSPREPRFKHTPFIV